MPEVCSSKLQLQHIMPQVGWLAAVGGRETSSSWPYGQGPASYQGTVFPGARWTLAKPLQPEVWHFDHVEGLAPS